MNRDITNYNSKQDPQYKTICGLLADGISAGLPDAENKLWHSHPVWFLEGNPIVGYSKQKAGIRLMFWSGKSFEEELLYKQGEKFQDASIFYNSVSEVNKSDLRRWLKKAKVIQWDYKNIVKKKGKLERL